ncbi:MAG: hypothetical protein CM15mP79_1350 [Methanobacteriota archaeon]|nr:MAG: hypothetical protein CM15mP79_1350 [Euryarchaeota archaeon]
MVRKMPMVMIILSELMMIQVTAQQPVSGGKRTRSMSGPSTSFPNIHGSGTGQGQGRDLFVIDESASTSTATKATVMKAQGTPCAKYRTVSRDGALALLKGDHGALRRPSPSELSSLFKQTGQTARFLNLGQDSCRKWPTGEHGS